MVLEIDTDILKKLGISADEYLYLYLSCKKASDTLVDLDLKVDLQIDLEKLQTKGYLKIGESHHTIRKEFLDLVQAPFSTMWSELLSYFPLKVKTKDGSIRVLRAHDADAKTNEKPRIKYEKYINGDASKHSQVIEALKTELEIRKKGDNLGYMQQLSTWVNNHTWEKYIGLDAEETTDSPRGRITRRL